MIKLFVSLILILGITNFTNQNSYAFDNQIIIAHNEFNSDTDSRIIEEFLREPSTIEAHAIENIETVGYECYSLINYRCSLECIDFVDRELKQRKCLRTCLKKNFESKNCE